MCVSILKAMQQTRKGVLERFERRHRYGKYKVRVSEQNESRKGSQWNCYRYLGPEHNRVPKQLNSLNNKIGFNLINISTIHSSCSAIALYDFILVFLNVPVYIS